MKKLLCFLVALSFLLIPFGVWAAGTVTQTLTTQGRGEWTLTFSWTGAASGGTVTAVDSKVAIDGYVYLVVTNPGSPAPSSNYSITLTDDQSIDIMGGELASRSATVTEQTVPRVDGVWCSRRVNGILTLNISGTTVSSAAGTVIVYFYRDVT